jgi:hypothetical protein
MLHKYRTYVFMVVSLIACFWILVGLQSLLDDNTPTSNSAPQTTTIPAHQDWPPYITAVVVMQDSVTYTVMDNSGQDTGWILTNNSTGKLLVVTQSHIGDGNALQIDKYGNATAPHGQDEGTYTITETYSGPVQYYPATITTEG